jgi:hypothetical protein
MREPRLLPYGMEAIILLLGFYENQVRCCTTDAYARPDSEPWSQEIGTKGPERECL